jgi:hypothetical protein
MFIAIMGASATESRVPNCFLCIQACHNTNAGGSDLVACICDACGSDCADC